ncbi:ATP-dependent DNA helicase [Corynebacterium uberis]|uniref:ATP-dependent DNA helicase n=1 Tax=Corynebacterium uberis TaxID=2883169 RepID=UPI001D0BC97B|nr:ATP-dependent DNA helicase [Corynebacterium uberis]UDL75430.1 ATP-dependent DNA helicase [Corynebacterium uberis]
MPAVPPTPKLLDAAVAALGGSARVGQEKMAHAVTRALDSGRHLAVQAGTGTGKSLAYLVPALRHAQATDTTVVVSTATIALQRQLVERDLPRLAEALEDELPHRPTFAIQKGRSNYLCLHKISAGEPTADLLDDAELTATGKQVRRLHDWAEQTTTGDRDSLETGVSDTVWRQVSVTSAECIGAGRCPHGADCFAELARQAARDVDVVVTNHALLAIDALTDSAVLPEHDAVIIDEAHELDARITSVSTAQLTPTSLRLVSRRMAALGASPDTFDTAVATWEERLPLLDQGRWRATDEDTHGLLVGLRDELWAGHLSVTSGGSPDDDVDTKAERANLANHMVDLYDTAVRILAVLDADAEQTPDDVVWLTEAALSVAPLSVAGLLAGHLFAQNTAVLTSATLSVGGNFDALAASWGLPSGTWDGLDVGTPFDPARAGILYIARHLPAPSREGPSPAALDEMAGLITAAGGRTLALFASRRAAQQAATALRARLPFDILVQGEDSTGVLVERFARNENTCLFGTLTLWQGVDVPGRSLSLVIIDKIPFPRPDDPLLQARKEAADAAGRNGFMSVAATHAALLLAQGAGRLLRSTTDRGVVAILDPRLLTKRYGSFLRASLPPLWPTSNPTTVREALRRLVAAR